MTQATTPMTMPANMPSTTQLQITMPRKPADTRFKRALKMQAKSLGVSALSLWLLAPACAPTTTFAQGSAPAASAGAAAATVGSLAATTQASAPMITRAGTQASLKGPAATFTGTVRVDPLFAASEPGRVSGAYVTFEPGARSNWHTHPYGQVLVVTAGVGRTQRWGGPIEEMRPGDVVRIPPGERHWHGAAPTTSVTHIAIQEHMNGKTVDWLEKVGDAEYGK